MNVLATGPSGPAHELDVLAAAGHTVTIRRPLDLPARRAYAEDELLADSNPDVVQRWRKP